MGFKKKKRNVVEIMKIESPFSTDDRMSMGMKLSLNESDAEEASVRKTFCYFKSESPSLCPQIDAKTCPNYDIANIGRSHCSINIDSGNIDITVDYSKLSEFFERSAIQRIQLDYFNIRRKMELIEKLRENNSPHLCYYLDKYSEIDKELADSICIMKIYMELVQLRNCSYDIPSHISKYLSENNYDVTLPLSEIVRDFVKKNDRNVSCRHCVRVIDGKKPQIAIDGLDSWIYLPINDPISLSYPSDTFGPEIYYESIAEINKILDGKNKEYGTEAHVYVSIHDSKKNSHKYFTFEFESCSSDAIRYNSIRKFKVDGKPDGIKVMTNRMGTGSSESNEKWAIAPKCTRRLKRMVNPSFWLSEREYSLLHPDLKSRYSLDDTKYNVFFADYLFTMTLLDLPKNSVLFNDSMRQSFIIFAILNSLV